ncbi:MAG: amidohydrolase [Acidobacteria bacterium]|nr:amidohydrolase [Acidobacteriota bacterium]
MTTKRCVFGLVLLMSVGLSMRGSIGQAPAAPDAIYVNATVITMDPAHPSAQAVAVRGDRIAVVGSNADVRKLADSHTTVVDLAGKVLLPGFVEPHNHFPGSGSSALFSVNLSSAPLGPITSIDDLVAALREKAQSTPKGQWVQGRGHDQTLLKEGRHPTRYDLDKASPDHPIYITHNSGHLSIANSKALELAHITKDTEAHGGVIEKDPKTGEPTGILEENAQPLVQRVIPPPSDADEREAIKWSVKDYASAGVTTATLPGRGVSPALQAASKAGLIPFRIVAMLGGRTSPYQMDPVSKLREWLQPAKFVGDEMLKTGLAVKLSDDGSIQGFTGYLSKPYHTPYRGDASYRGYPHETREEMLERVKLLHAAGYQIATHANGDAGIDDTIYAYREALRERPKPDHRFRIEHAQMTREDQLDAMKELGITPSFFVSHTYFWGDQHRDIFQGPERAAHISPLASAVKRGIRFSIHLDTPVTPMSPLQAVWSAVNRLTRSGKVLGPDQRIKPLEALRAVTIDAAWQSFEEKIKGSIEPGKFADLVILAENPLTIDPVRIKDIAVLETIVGGRTIYKKEGTSTSVLR